MTLTTIDGKLPGFLAGRRSSGSLAAARTGVQGAFAVISYLGKTWTIKYRNEKTLVKDNRGQPIQELEVVIVGASPSISKNYYAKGYTSGDDAAPDCSSIDGLTPDPSSPHIQNKVCATCPQNQWGSQMTPDGKKAKACRDGRRLAIVPLGDIPNEAFGGPMLLRIPPTTLVNFANYADLLERKGVGDMSWVGTKLTFDPTFAYPRIQFSAVCYVDEDQDKQLAEVMKGPAIDRILYNFGPAEAASAPAAVVEDVDDDIPGTPPARGKVTQLPPRRQVASDPPAPRPEEEEEEEGEPEDEEETVVTPPPPVSEPPAARARRTPFGAAASKPPTQRPATRAATPAPAPSDLEGAIDDLLDQSA